MKTIADTLRRLYAVCFAVSMVGMTGARAANPIITTAFSADPSGHVFGDRLYLYASHDRVDAQQYDMNDYHVYSTDDAQNWQDHGVALSLPQIPWAKAHLWAPDCGFKNGMYYLYFPADTTGKYTFAVGVATSRSPTGPFVAEPLPIPGVGGIDPSVFTDDDGQSYLLWAAGAPTICKLTPDMKSLDGAPVKIKGCDSFFEGPWLFKRQGLYYLTYPAFQPGGSGRGGHGQNYDYAVSSTPLGPYTYKGTFTKSGPGAGNIHGSQVEWGDTWYCFYHDCALSQGDRKSGFKRSVRLDEMHFNADGTIAPLAWTTTGPPQRKPLNPFVRCEAETLCQTDGPLGPHAVSTEACVEGGVDLGSLNEGDWARYAGVDFGKGASTFQARGASPLTGGSLEMHLDRLDGPLVGACPIPNTGGWQMWTTIGGAVHGAAGLHDLYLVMRGPGSGGLFNIDWFQFTPVAPERKKTLPPQKPNNRGQHRHGHK